MNPNKTHHVRLNMNVLPSVTATENTINIKAKKFINLPSRNDKNESLCFNCFTYGHASRYCTKPKNPKCTRFGKFGHEVGSCSNTKENATLVVSLVSLTPNKKIFF